MPRPNISQIGYRTQSQYPNIIAGPNISTSIGFASNGGDSLMENSEPQQSHNHNSDVGYGAKAMYTNYQIEQQMEGDEQLGKQKQTKQAKTPVSHHLHHGHHVHSHAHRGICDLEHLPSTYRKNDNLIPDLYYSSNYQDNVQPTSGAITSQNPYFVSQENSPNITIEPGSRSCSGHQLPPTKDLGGSTSYVNFKQSNRSHHRASTPTIGSIGSSQQSDSRHSTRSNQRAKIGSSSNTRHHNGMSPMVPVH